LERSTACGKTKGQNSGEGQWCECSQFGAQRQGDADYLDGCRQKRNIAGYDYAGGTTKQNAGELIRSPFTRSMRVTRRI
jgi:hypothetical protein